MTRRVAILGLGDRGVRWARTFHSSGWAVAGFDPDPSAGKPLNKLPDWRREKTISSTVQGADWVFCCLPDRLELMQMVLQRAQAEAPASAIVAVAARTYDIEAVQACTIRPGQVVRVTETDDGGLALDVSERNIPETRAVAREGLAGLAAVLSMQADEVEDQARGAESA